MHFQISKRSRDVALLGEPPAAVEEFTWRLVSKAGTLCVSAHVFASAGQARGDIADFKRAVSGARFAKVLDPSEADARG